MGTKKFKSIFRYGELETSLINLVVKERRDQTSSPAPTTSTETPLASALTPNSQVTIVTIACLTKNTFLNLNLFYPSLK